MEKVSQALYKRLKEVTDEVFYKINYKKELVYPYVIYDLDNERDTDVSDDYFFSLYLYDRSKSQKGILKLEKELREHLDGLRFEDNNGYYSILFNSTNTVPLVDESIQQLNVEYDVKVYYKHG